MVPQILMVLLVFVFGATSVHAQNFTSRVLARDMGQAVDVMARDFDYDGDIDLTVSTLSPGNVFYYDRRPDSLYRFESYVAGGSGRQIAAGDFDSDGDLDVVFASNGEHRLIMLENNPQNAPANRFTMSILVSDAAGPYSVLAGDFTGDGVVDLVATEVSTERVRLFRQIAGSLEDIWQNSFGGSLDPLGVALTDLENDGVKEILVAVGSNNGGLYLMRRTQIGTYTLTQEIDETYLAAIAAGDLDNDGNVDVVGCDFSSDILRRWERTATGWTNSQFPSGLNNPRDVIIEDFDSDGLADIAATGQGLQGAGGGVTWWRQTSSGTFVAQVLNSESGFYGLEPVDYDRDGDIDLLAANAELEQIIMFENRMGTPTRIIGHVTAERGGDPIEGVLVRAEETGVTNVSDENGRYELGMIEGVFTLSFEHPCWATSEVTAVQTFADDTTFADATMRRPVMELPVTSLNLFVQNELPSTYELWIVNSGDAPLQMSAEIEDAQPNMSWVSVSPTELEIAPGHEEMFGVTFSPDTSNDRDYEILGSLRLQTNSCPDTSVNMALVIVVLDAPERNSDLIPSRTQIGAAYPNPFNPTVNLPIEISVGGDYTLHIFDVLGRKAASLFNGKLEPGRFEFTWQANGLASGRYIAVLQSADGTSYETPLMLIK